MPTWEQKENAARNMEHLVDHDWHGYTQGPGRWGDGEGVCEVQGVNGVMYVNQGDRDCSAADVSCYQDAGIDCGGATWTGDALDCMLASGNFRAHRMSDGWNCDDGYIAQRGDAYLAHHTGFKHMAMCLSSDPDMLGEFVISENGTIYGEVGDQTGWESHRRAYYGGWDWCLEAIVEEAAPPKAWPLIMWGSNGGENQRFDLIEQGGGLYAIVCRADGRALDVLYESSEDGAGVQLYEPHYRSNQLWRIFTKFDGTCEIVTALDESKCLDVKGATDSEGANLVIWPRHGGANQEWVVLDNRDGSKTIINNGLGRKMVLDCAGGGE